MRPISKNKRIGYDYEITDTLEVGIVLSGSEVKSLREGKINIKDAVVLMHDEEMRAHQIDIPLYSKSSYRTLPGYEAKGKRKLLIKRSQIKKWNMTIKKTGQKIVIMEIYRSNKQRVKLKIGLAKRKKKIEKRSAIKEKETRRQMDKAMKGFGM